MYGTVEMQFREIANTRLHTATSLKTGEVELLPLNLERRASRVKVEDKHQN